jgi:hypothetical protein
MNIDPYTDANVCVARRHIMTSRLPIRNREDSHPEGLSLVAPCVDNDNHFALFFCEKMGRYNNSLSRKNYAIIAIIVIWRKTKF